MARLLPAVLLLVVSACSRSHGAAPMAGPGTDAGARASVDSAPPPLEFRPSVLPARPEVPLRELDDGGVELDMQDASIEPCARRTPGQCDPAVDSAVDPGGPGDPGWQAIRLDPAINACGEVLDGCFTLTYTFDDAGCLIDSHATHPDAIRYLGGCLEQVFLERRFACLEGSTASYSSGCLFP